MAVLVLALTSATGIGSVMHYSVTMMTEAGLVGARANVADAAMRVCGLLAALVSAAFIDRRGRAFVLKIGTAGAAVALAALGSLFLALARYRFGNCRFHGGSRNERGRSGVVDYLRIDVVETSVYAKSGTFGSAADVLTDSFMSF